jgi:protein-disulfide isomerase
VKAGRAWILAAIAIAVTSSADATTAPKRHGAKAAQAKDWSKSFSQTPDGWFVMGNPDAKIDVVEYGSMTCPHCRHFAATAMKPLVAQYVRTGKARFEYRSMVLNEVDTAATLLARCAGSDHFFPLAEQLYATQPTWLARITDDQSQKIEALPQDEQKLGIAKATGLIPVAKRYGISENKAEACLRDTAEAARLEQSVQTAIDAGVQGTPTIFVNGKQVPAYDWDTLKPFLKEAGG